MVHQANGLVICFILVLIRDVCGFGTNCGRDVDAENPSLDLYLPKSEMPPNLKVAFMGDTGTNFNAPRVYQQVRDWGAHFMILGGDYDYSHMDPYGWIQQINSVMGPDYAFFATIGNHDIFQWEQFHDIMEARLERTNTSQYCVGEYGINMVCNYEGLVFVMSGIGERGVNHVAFIDQAFRQNPSKWKICSFHKVQQLYHAGGRQFGDYVGWPIYETCREHGAIIVTAHVHQYCRTHQMANFERTQISAFVGNVSDANNPMIISPGRSFNVVSGCGGAGLSPFADNMERNPWWGATAAPQIGMTYGALLCTFKVNGQDDLAECRYEDFNGVVFDSFVIRSFVPDDLPIQTKNLECGSQFIDVQIRKSEDDMELLETGDIQCSGKDLFSDGKVILRFSDVPAQSIVDIDTAHLEFFGLSTPPDEFTVQIFYDGSFDSSSVCEQDGSFPALSQNSNSEGLQDSITWQVDTSESDSHQEPLWVSPNLNSLLKGFGAENFETDHIPLVFVITATNQTSVASFDKSPCMAPSFVVQTKNKCD